MILQVGVKAFLRNDEGKYLILMRSDKYGKFAGKWDLPGGRIEVGTNLFENLKREVREETRLEIVSLPKLICAQDILRHNDKHVVRLTYTAEAKGEIILDTSENTEYKWLSIDEIAKIENLDEFVKEIIEKGSVN